MGINRIYRYAALVLGLLYGTFLFFMALDSIPFEWKSKEVEGFLIHASPGIIIIIGAIAGFKRPVTGFIIFLIITIISTWFFHTYRDISNFMVISFPALLVALLFMVSFQGKKG
ncbi:MAG TPA: hypothetical protein VMV77_09430 [Bacteroidales bacterium]|nr:hypothetical protein [Bacteroidales bacterium]